MNTGRYALGGTGLQTAALAFGGVTTTDVTATEEYDGTTWTNGGNMSGTAGRAFACAGTQTSALGAGGYRSPAYGSTETEEYDGTSWTAGGNLNTGRRGPSGAGTQTSALAFGGFSNATQAVTGATEQYNGTSWTNATSMATARGYLVACGTQTAGLAAGGTGSVQATEEFTGGDVAVTKTVTAT